MGKELTILNDRWKVWCAVFAGTFDINKACETSGLKRSTVAEYKDDPLINAEIVRCMENTIAAANVDAVELLQHLSNIMHSDIIDIYDEYGRFKPLHEWPQIWRQQLESIEYDGYIIKKVKFIRKMEVINAVGRHVDVRAFEDKVVHKHEVGEELADLIRKGRQRASGHLIEGEVVQE